ncbi:MAG: site-specific DNA-methyltransferase [Candidatus Nomurabacteria bacterium]|jgi:adenine-specific DNA-methyltransferase|nr:site-specific DNA-methyltransferase [Candidatus Nomurabacteria bacterium]
MNGQSDNIVERNLTELARIFPEAFSEGKVDWDRLRATLGENIELGERYGLSWKGKSDVFRAIQEQTSKTLKPAEEESVDFDKTQNIFIEGDNLETLKILHRAYYGKIKMIYIDPPYNTGNDFVYNDKFAESRRDYLAESDDHDADGERTRTDGLVKNGRDSGYWHSNWLNMMYPRLFLARNLLRQDGVIFVSIDDNEVANLRLIMDEIFGVENFIANIIWQKKYTQSNDANNLSYTHEYLTCYARSIDERKSILNRLPRSEEQNARYTNPDRDPRGVWKSIPLHARSGTKREEIHFSNGVNWTPPAGTFNRFNQQKITELENDNRIYFGKNGSSTPVFKKFLSEVGDIVPNSLWKYEEVGSTDSARREIKELIPQNVFDTPKPVSLIKRLCQIGTDGKKDIILDFFAGSGTTAQAVAELNAEDGGNRKWILVQLPEETDEKSEARKAGFATIADISKERIRRAGQKIIKENLKFPNETKNGMQLASHGYSYARKIGEKISMKNITALDQHFIDTETGEDFYEKFGKNDPKDKYRFDPNALDIGFRVYKLSESNLRKWRDQMDSSDDLRGGLLDQIAPLADNASDNDLLIELLLKNGIRPTEKIVGKGDYLVAPNGLIICLSRTLTHEIFAQILAEKPTKVILLDIGFQNNSQLKANTLLAAEQGDVGAEVV